ncbi:uncharacterized protein LOC124945230 isoform X2 [Impatiens glandulifera]|uniref:uncharacterized protein LOC124945230 isoform X2 n=1 Tax=Impatiens glandulifera TaxID=253017 RepID=UPI001FB124B5|nr:uncharacterized protein LOC124945230 isoform X2 [Impatiens glandulifera]
MAAAKEQQYHQDETEEEEEEEVDHCEKLLTTYIGISFAVFLGLLPKSSISFVSNYQSRNRDLSLHLEEAEEQLRELYSRRKEDSKANARVVEIFASHRHAWQQEERRLLRRIEDDAEEISHLRAKVEELEKSEAELTQCVDDLRREVGERDEMLNFMSQRPPDFAECLSDGGGGGGGGWCSEALMEKFGGGVRVSDGLYPGEEEAFRDRERYNNMDKKGYTFGQNNAINPEFLSSASKLWLERPSSWQDVHYESPEPMYQVKHFVSRESPWKVDGESTGIASKLKLLEQGLVNLERVCSSDLSKVPSMMSKQAKRYQTLAGKIDDLCRRMQASDPCEPTLGLEIRTQRQNEFLFEAFQLQQRASDAGQKLMALQLETVKQCMKDEKEEEEDGQVKVATNKRCLDSIKNNLREIQRNLEIWLARIIGDLKGILSRDGGSRGASARDYYISRYPFPPQ